MSAKHLTCTIENYHRSPAIGCSMLKAFDDHPKLYQGRYVTGEAAPFKGNTSTEFGNRVDAWLLERDRCIEIPTEVLGKNGAKSTKAYFAWRDENTEYVHFTERDATICERIEANVREHTDAAKLLYGDGESQYSIFWTDPETGLECKCRPDIVRPGVLVDLKTSKSTHHEKFAYQSLDLHYDWQSVHYRRGWYELTGDWLAFLFLVVRNCEPYDVKVIKLDDEWVADAEIEVASTLRAIAASKESGVWLPEGYGDTLEIKRPKKAEFKKAWEVDSNGET